MNFFNAVPVWPDGRRCRVNDFVLFSAEFESSEPSAIQLHITGCTMYRIRCNGQFVAYGPARGPQGYFRVDEIPLPAVPGRNKLEIEVSGSNCNSFYYMNQPSFLLAEIFERDTVIAWTGRDFRAFDLAGERPPKVPRMAVQRMFSEVYSVKPQRRDLPELALEECPAVKLLPRCVPQPEYCMDESYRPVKTVHRRYDPSAPVKTINHSVAEWKGGYTMSPTAELAFDSEYEMQHFPPDPNGPIESTVFEGAINNSGFLRLQVTCRRPGRLVLFFDEVLSEPGVIDPTRAMTVNAIFWNLEEAGSYELEAFETNTCRYVECFMASGEAMVQSVAVREYKSPLFKDCRLETCDAGLQAIFRAGCETLAANAVDCLTDCPSRERAAWLCDSFFSSRAAYLLTGNTLLEYFFLENFALAPQFEYLPQGMIPMLYPGDHPGGLFIPNWAMWLVLETEEYLHRSGDRAMIDALRGRFMGLVSCLDGFLNPDGLLEKLPSWVFVEWSKANDFVQDVNYPSNMLYAAMLESLSRLYGDRTLAERARQMREVIRRQSWNGTWFRDHAVRRADGSLEVQNTDITETCQYYAFFFRTATPETHPELWRRLIQEFGPRRAELGLWKEIYPSNAFIGNYLRLELLSGAGLHQQLLEECKGYFLKMAETTGTLWEHDSPQASCCHGFASYVNVLLDRAVKASRSKQ